MPPYKAILLDLDNTLYYYPLAHEKALQSTLFWLSREIGENFDKLKESYASAKQKTQNMLQGLAASHHRLLYFQRMIETIAPKKWFLSKTAYHLYWDTFLKYMRPREHMELFLQELQPTLLCIVTDFIADIQYRKLEKLGIQDKIDYLVTSEEAGHEKPHPRIYQLALNKLQVSASDACMIGDHFQKDVLGAWEVGIDAYWLNEEKAPINLFIPEGVTVVKGFMELLEEWKCRQVKL